MRRLLCWLGWHAWSERIPVYHSYVRVCGVCKTRRFIMED